MLSYSRVTHKFTRKGYSWAVLEVWRKGLCSPTHPAHVKRFESVQWHYYLLENELVFILTVTPRYLMDNVELSCRSSKEKPTWESNPVNSRKLPNTITGEPLGGQIAFSFNLVNIDELERQI